MNNEVIMKNNYGTNTSSARQGSEAERVSQPRVVVTTKQRIAAERRRSSRRMPVAQGAKPTRKPVHINLKLGIDNSRPQPGTLTFDRVRTDD